MAKKRKHVMEDNGEEEGEWVDETGPTGLIAESTSESEWHTPDVLPPRDTKIEMDSCGELLIGTYDGVWRPDGSIRGVNVQRWRLA